VRTSLKILQDYVHGNKIIRAPPNYVRGEVVKDYADGYTDHLVTYKVERGRGSRSDLWLIANNRRMQNLARRVISFFANKITRAETTLFRSCGVWTTSANPEATQPSFRLLLPSLAVALGALSKVLSILINTKINTFFPFFSILLNSSWMYHTTSTRKS
jgi:hypothetical protein